MTVDPVSLCHIIHSKLKFLSQSDHEPSKRIVNHSTYTKKIPLDYTAKKLHKEVNQF